MYWLFKLPKALPPFTWRKGEFQISIEIDCSAEKFSWLKIETWNCSLQKSDLLQIKKFQMNARYLNNVQWTRFSFHCSRLLKRASLKSFPPKVYHRNFRANAPVDVTRLVFARRSLVGHSRRPEEATGGGATLRMATTSEPEKRRNPTDPSLTRCRTRSNVIKNLNSPLD